MTKDELASSVDKLMGYFYADRKLSAQFYQEWWTEFQRLPQVVFDQAAEKWKRHNKTAPNIADMQQAVRAFRAPGHREQEFKETKLSEPEQRVNDHIFPIFMDYLHKNVPLFDFVYELRGVAIREGSADLIPWHMFHGLSDFVVPEEWNCSPALLKEWWEKNAWSREGAV